MASSRTSVTNSSESRSASSVVANYLSADLSNITVTGVNDRNDSLGDHINRPGQNPVSRFTILREICRIFCCPPIPSHIVSKVAFAPPTPPTYLISNSSPPTLSENPAAIGQPNTAPIGTFLSSSNVNWSLIEIFFTTTRRGNSIPCIFIRSDQETKYTVLCSHGNAVDLGHMLPFYYTLVHRLNVNIFAYDYSGYGAASGTPSEANLYSDIKAAWEALKNRYGIVPPKIVLYGQSIGTAPTIRLASEYDVGGVILHSPLTSGLNVVCPQHNRTCITKLVDPFDNLQSVQKITSKVLVIHGTNDEVVDFAQGMEIYDHCSNPVEPLWVEGGGHNDIELQRFFTVDLAQTSN